MAPTLLDFFPHSPLLVLSESKDCQYMIKQHTDRMFSTSVTVVGGTANVPEIAAYFSGGGFSNYFSRPDYQENAVTGFFNKYLPDGTYSGLFNR